MVLLTVIWIAGAGTSSAADWKTLPGHVPKEVSGMNPLGRLSATNRLNLAIGLPFRDPAGVDNLLAQIYDPASPQYRKYLTPDEFTARFAPTPAAYQSVIAFAVTNGLTVRATHGDRMLLEVSGPVAAVEKAFHITLHTYRHPTDARDFFAPDTEPMVDVSLPVADVGGLNNFTLPHPKLHKQTISSVAARATPHTGSASGAYMGNDFRGAYLPGVTLNGAGQMVGLLQFDGFYSNDITAYETSAGIPAIPIQTVLTDSYNGVPTSSGNIEVSVDIEMAMAMAPGLSKIVVFEADPSYGQASSILAAMVANPSIKQFSCSWGWGGGPDTTVDNYFKQMAAQGQTFFNATGDSDAFTAGASSVNGVDNPRIAIAPSSSPYITQVGGTTLTTTGPGGAWSSETVWNWGGTGSSGGISSHYLIASTATWQTNISMAANGGSTTYRNVPDVALTADNVFVRYGNGSSSTVGGTSCAAPLWAGLAAVINQQALASGKSPVGFLNPAIYAIGSSPSYNSCFNDVTTGNNFWGSSPGLFNAVTGYDLCTGWGTPSGLNLMNALVGATVALVVSPANGFAASGPVGGPFNPVTGTFQLTNASSSSMNWGLVNTSAWLNVSSTGGTLPAGTQTTVTVGLSSAANGLLYGNYTATVLVTNQSGLVTSLLFNLQAGQSLIQNGGFETGDFTGWTLAGNTVIGNNIYNAVESSASYPGVVHSGGYGALLGATNLALLSQTLSTVPGQNYLLSFWLANPAGGTGQAFDVNWISGATNQLYQVSSPPTMAWTNLNFIVNATGTTATIQFGVQNVSGYFGLDDVNVTPLPAVTLKTAVPVAKSFQLTWNALNGFSYQIQYKTNLMQATWINLGNSLTSSNGIIVVNDTSATPSTGQRFYRLVQSP